MMKYLQPLIFQSLSLFCAMALTSCGFWKNETPLASSSQTVPAVAVSQDDPKPLNLPVTRTWEFDVDSRLTTGTIDLAMNPKGAMLGTRTARDTSKLKGKVIVSITEDPVTGKRQMSIKDIRLANTEAYHMDFAWGVLVGSITVDIPVGVLSIIPNDLKQVCPLGENKSFSLSQCYFKVLGHSHVRGRGLVLAKAVPNQKVNLTMKKTERVALSGTIVEKNGIATLRVPRAVLRDHFDLDGTQLGLVFTADITATAKVR